MEVPIITSHVNGLDSTSTSVGSEPPQEVVSTSRYALQAIQLLEEGQLQAALQLLNLCLGDTDEADSADLEKQVSELLGDAKKSGIVAEARKASVYDESSLVEKRCLVNLKLKRYGKVIQDAKKMIGFSSENPVAYKCLLIALCKMKKVDYFYNTYYI